MFANCILYVFSPQFSCRFSWFFPRVKKTVKHTGKWLSVFFSCFLVPMYAEMINFSYAKLLHFVYTALPDILKSSLCLILCHWGHKATSKQSIFCYVTEYVDLTKGQLNAASNFQWIAIFRSNETMHMQKWQIWHYYLINNVLHIPNEKENIY